MEVILLNNLLPKSINLEIINVLGQHPFHIAYDTNDIKLRHNNLLLGKSNGFNIITIDEGKIMYDSILNVYGNIISEIIKNKLELDNYSIERLYWNLYLNKNNTQLHTDRDHSNFISIVYNLHTTDGGTEINKKFYPDIMGQAKIFKSNVLHRGIGPIEDPVRFSLNIILKENIK